MGQVIYVGKLGQAKGQTLFCAHLATILSEQKKCALIDFQPQNHLLEMFVAKRHHFNLKEKQNLPVPTYLAYHKNIVSESLKDYDFLVLDSSDRSLIKDADIVLTLVSDPALALELSKKESEISNVLWNAKKERAASGKSAFKHVLIPTASFDMQTTEKLLKSDQKMGYMLAPVLENNPSYTKGLKDGVCVLDKNLPYFKNVFDETDFFARRNLKQILEFIFADK